MSYGRRLQLGIGDTLIEYNSSRDLRVAFDVTRSKTRDPNAAAIQVHNLNPATRGALEQQERASCELSAGYADESTHVIFAGVLLHIESYRADGGIVTDLQLGDDTEQKAAIPRIHKNFPTGTPISNVLQDLVSATGLKGGNFAEAAPFARLVGGTALQRPWFASGQALSELHAFARSLGFQWTMQDQQVIFTGLGRGTGGSGPVFTGDNVPETPQIDADGLITLTGRLVPELVPGRPFEVDTAEVQGRFVATDTRHYGDTSGTDWSVFVTGEPFDRAVSDGVQVNGA